MSSSSTSTTSADAPPRTTHRPSDPHEFPPADPLIVHPHNPEETDAARNERLRKLFHDLDTRGEGALSVEGLRDGLVKINHPLAHADHLLREILAAADTSRDGLIQPSEFTSFFHSAERSLYRIFSSVDTDSNGKISKDELSSALHRAGISVDKKKLDAFFDQMDRNSDGVISFAEWRDFLMFMPGDTTLKAIYGYYLATVNVNPEGDVVLADEINLKGLGYFLAGGLAGAISRTATAPFDRLKVFLIAQTNGGSTGVASVAGVAKEAATKPLATVAKVGSPIRAAFRELYAAGGLRSFFAGNGLNVIKVLPESSIKFGTWEASKRLFARMEGVEDMKQLSPAARFTAGGIGGVVSQLAIYPIDTLKFRMQCEMKRGSLKGNALIYETARKTWLEGAGSWRAGVFSFYRGLPLSLMGIFPYSALDLTLYELFKRRYLASLATSPSHPVHPDTPLPTYMTLVIGAASGSIGATAVYPINLLRTRMQAQGTELHRQRYDGIKDVVQKTWKQEGVRGMYRGLTPNLLKVAPAMSLSYLVYENCKRAMGLE